MAVVSMYPRYLTKWQTARKHYLSAMRLVDQDFEAAIKSLIISQAEAAKFGRAGNSKAELRAERLQNTITYAVNLAFGTDLASK